MANIIKNFINNIYQILSLYNGANRTNKNNSFGIDDDINQIVTNIDNYDINALEENESSFYKFMNQIDSDENDKKLKNSTKSKKDSNDKSGNSSEKYKNEILNKYGEKGYKSDGKFIFII